MARQLCCRDMYRLLLRSDGQQRNYSKTNFRSNLNCGQKTVSETGHLSVFLYNCGGYATKRNQTSIHLYKTVETYDQNNQNFILLGSKMTERAFLRDCIFCIVYDFRCQKKAKNYHIAKQASRLYNSCMSSNYLTMPRSAQISHCALFANTS